MPGDFTALSSSAKSSPVNNAAVRREDCTLAIMSAAARPLPDASPTTQARRVTLQWDEIVAIAAQRPNLTTVGAIVQGIASRAGRLHKGLLYVAGPVPSLD